MRIPVTKRPTSLALSLTAMVDVVFLLLVYFLWSTQQQRPEFDLPAPFAAIAPPNAGNAQASAEKTPLFDEIIVGIDNDAILLNRLPMADINELELRLNEIAELSRTAKLVIAPSETTSTGRAVAIFDLAKLAGFTEVHLAAREPFQNLD